MTEWKRQWGYDLSTEPIREGIYRLKSGGYLLRVTVTHPRTGQRKDRSKVVHDASLPQAIERRDELIVDLRARLESPKPEMPLFFDYTALLFETKVQREKIRSGAGRKKWEEILRLHLYPVFGPFPLDQVRHDDVEQWFLSYASAITKDVLSPRTANARLGILKVIYAAGSARYGFPDPTRGIEPFETILHPTYTPEEPNSLTPDELPLFLHAMHEHCTPHYAVTLLGFVTGLRPSTLFPILIDHDVKWESRQIWVRRSHTIAQEVMSTTKTGIGYPIGRLHLHQAGQLRWLKVEWIRRDDIRVPLREYQKGVPAFCVVACPVWRDADLVSPCR
jgi:hypothetical protein